MQFLEAEGEGLAMMLFIPPDRAYVLFTAVSLAPCTAPRRQKLVSVFWLEG